MYAEIAAAATGTTTLKNENTITVDQGNSVGMYILNNSGDKSKAVVINDTAGKIETKKQTLLEYLQIRELLQIWIYWIFWEQVQQEFMEKMTRL